MHDTEIEFAGVIANECPFCGGHNLAWETLYHNQAPYWYIVCRSDDCFAQDPIDLGKSGAISKWNMNKEEKYTPPIIKTEYDIFDYQNDQDKG